MKYIIFIITITCVSTIQLTAQNLIRNASFELKKNFLVQDNKPNAPIQLDSKCKRWKSAGTSPDWFKSQDEGHFKVREIINSEFVDVQAFSGVGYAGMLPTEMMYEELADDLNGLRHKFSAWIRVSDKTLNLSFLPLYADVNVTWSETTEANLYVYLGKNELDMQYIQPSVLCANLNNDKRGPVVEVVSIPITLSEYPSGQWHKVEAEFLVPGTDFKWIGLETDACPGFLMLDDIFLEEIPCEECSITCDPVDGCIDHVVLNNPHGQDDPFSIKDLANVDFLKLEIFTTGGIHVKTIEIDNPPNIVSWDGKNEAGVEVSAGNYIYELTLKNSCEFSFLQNNQIFKSNSILEPTVFIPETMTYESVLKQDLINDQCCYECIEISANTIDYIIPPTNISEIGGIAEISGNLNIIGINKIVVDENVFFLPGSNVVLQAGEEILFDKDNTNILPGAQLSCFIDDCEPGFMGDNPDEFMINAELIEVIEREEIPESVDDILADKRTESEIKQSPSGVEFSVYPNPSSDGVFTVDLKSTFSESINIEVRNVFGTNILSNTVSSQFGSIFTIDLSNEPDGMFFLVIRSGNKKYVRKIIKR